MTLVTDLLLFCLYDKYSLKVQYDLRKKSKNLFHSHRKLIFPCYILEFVWVFIIYRVL